MEPDKSQEQQPPFAERCVVCLEIISNPASLNSCIHRFCLNCIMQWAEIAATCPACRSKFTQISIEENGVQVPVTNLGHHFPCNPNHQRRNINNQGNANYRSPNGIIEWVLASLQTQHSVIGTPLFRRQVYARRQFVQRLPRDPDGRVSTDRDAIFAFVNRELVSLLNPDHRDPSSGSHFFDLIEGISQLAQRGLFDRIRVSVEPFLHSYTDHFLHELTEFVLSNSTVQSFDLNCHYQ